MRKAGSGAPRTVLATDLDGTFLGGSVAQRATLYDWIAQRRDEIVLIFVSGRGIEFMRDLADEPASPAAPRTSRCRTWSSGWMPVGRPMRTHASARPCNSIRG